MAFHPAPCGWNGAAVGQDGESQVLAPVPCLLRLLPWLTAANISRHSSTETVNEGIDPHASRIPSRRALGSDGQRRKPFESHFRVCSSRSKLGAKTPSPPYSRFRLWISRPSSSKHEHASQAKPLSASRGGPPPASLGSGQQRCKSPKAQSVAVMAGERILRSSRGALDGSMNAPSAVLWLDRRRGFVEVTNWERDFPLLRRSFSNLRWLAKDEA